MAQDKDTEESGKKDFAVSAAEISLPKGGGAIRGIGEKFGANLVTGTGSIAVPIATSPGRAGFGPQLSLSYDSGAGNGPFGLGWNLSLPSITRKTDKGIPKYQDGDESDTFILSGAEDFVPVLKRQGNDWVWLSGPLGWVLRNPRVLTEPIEYTGARRLWEVKPEVVRTIRRQLSIYNG